MELPANSNFNYVGDEEEYAWVPEKAVNSSRNKSTDLQENEKRLMTPVEASNRETEDIARNWKIRRDNYSLEIPLDDVTSESRETTFDQGLHSGGESFQPMEGDDDAYFYDEDMTRIDAERASTDTPEQTRSRLSSDSDLVFRTPIIDSRCQCKTVLRYFAIVALFFSLGLLFGYFVLGQNPKTPNNNDSVTSTTELLRNYTSTTVVTTMDLSTSNSTT